MSEKMKAALLQIREALRVDDPHGHYDLVCEALAEQPAKPWVAMVGDSLTRGVWSQAEFRAAHGMALLDKPKQGEPVEWRFTGPAGLKRYMTQQQYEAQTPEIQRWYEPVASANRSDPPAPSVPDDVATDAARYRWMVKHCADVSLNDHNHLWHCQWRDNQGCRTDWHLSDGHATADQAVDEAMTASIAMLAASPEPRS